MGESVDVKALRAMFHAQANMATNISSSEDSGQTTSPLPGFGRGALLGANGLGQHKQFLASPFSAPVPSHGQGKYKAPPSAISVMKPQHRAPVVPAALTPGPRAHATESGRVRETGEMLQNIMLSHPRPPSAKLTPGTSTPSAAPALPPGPAIPVTPARPLPSRASLDDVTPLRRPLPPEGPWPIKPRRPPKVNLELYLRATSAPKIPKHPGQMKNISLSTPGLFSPPGPPQPPKKPSGLAQQLTPIMDDDNSDDTYDDIGSLGNSDSLNDVSQRVGGASDDSEAYDVIDEKLDMNKGHSDKQNQKEVKRQREQEKKEQKERLKREIALRKKFQLQGEIEVLHTARVRQDWQGGKLDLSVQQGESVEILRVKNNPGGKWLVRTLTGKYGYISNTCVDIDYEEMKRKVLHSKGSPALPPPPPDPPQNHNGYFHVDSANREDSLSQDDQDDYAYVEPSDSFPPPPPEISIDPKLERELKKKFKFEGPLRILHTMMVDPNGIIRKPGGKDLAVAQGEILDVIQHTSDKKALCRNQLGKFGYVSRSLLLQMEGDIYDDIDTHEDVYDND